ncbi:helicase-associated domain-containing protein [Catenulispora sp. NF23]|uniref:helicase-associated domain-containing protein n=1 Tax=Catenulispora pinistramenti TaxID=2705254 RepID=UPI001BAB4547|nr:helicase-associated domain-containing protein [Catenulispora pinistramenti]MBS2535917.1 helicase-associated domain-containing protein [Catenulispora pinistramenti]
MEASRGWQDGIVHDLFSSLAHHVASLPQDGVDALMGARPDVAEVLFGDVPDGQEAQADVGSITEALVDPDGVAEAVLRLSRPAVQVLMALVDAAEGDYGGLRHRFGGLGFADLARRGAGGIGVTEVIRVLSMAGGAVEVDPHSARAALCESLTAAARPAAMAEFDRILVRLTDSCLVWPEPGGRSFRIHDVVMDVLPEPAPEWEGFDLVQPLPEVARRLPVADVAGEAQAAAIAALDSAERLLRQVATDAVPLLKAGGVGVREVKRLVRASGLAEEAIRFWLYIADSAGLVACQDDKLWATPEYDRWISAEPSQRYAALLGAWLTLPTSVLGPFALTDAAGKPPAVLSDSAFDGVGHYVRAVVLELMATCGGGAVVEAGSLADALVWRMPLLMDPEDEGIACGCGECDSQPAGGGLSGKEAATAAVASVFAEGGLLGAVAFGALAPVARTLLTGSQDDVSAMAADIAAALTATVPESVGHVRLQSDMTVVAAGLPSARLTAFFDATAEREAAGAATVWRITDSSVRRWLDSGRSAEELRSGLAEFCVDEPSQALSYLIDDAARRHGLVDVIAAQAVIVTADEKLGDELAMVPVLVRLGVRRIAGTVLVLDAPQQEVLSVLRFAGYLPSAHQADGAVTVTAVAPPRASPEAVPRF